MSEPQEKVALTFQKFDTFYAYTLGDTAAVYYFPKLPCVECGSEGVFLVRCQCIECGESHSGMYCADSYGTREGTALTIVRESLRCRFCDTLGKLAAALVAPDVPRQGMH